MFTREAGVRNLEREIGSICRKIATQITEGQEKDRFSITPNVIEELLGRARFLETDEIVRRTTIPGVATGLAWTPNGGSILFIEATRMQGAKGFTITGSIGKVMQESAQAALSYVRAHAADYGIAPDFYETTDIHLHVPAGAQPKDGPSAGVTMVTALVSLLTGRATRRDVGMTGEITLSGQVLPIGGIKEKVLAAHRARLKTIILPKENENDLDDLPEEIRKELNFVLAETILDALNAALEGKG